METKYCRFLKNFFYLLFSTSIVMSAIKASVFPTEPHKNPMINLYKESELNRLYQDVVVEIVRTVQENPQAIIIFPTGSTPIPLYKALVERFKSDPFFDLSQVQFFNLDEYVGLEKDHPLSYRYYMDYYFYHPLQAIDASRAPKKENIHIPDSQPGELPAHTAARYEQELTQAFNSSPTKCIDLAILGVGGAYPEKEATGQTKLKGGHIAFNEPGTPFSQRTFVVNLTDKTRLDTTYRFSALKRLIKTSEIKFPYKVEVPYQAISLGIGNIFEAKKIIVLATGEDKGPVVENALNKGISSDFPASYLQKHPNVK